MSKRLVHELRYDGASIPEVAAMLADEGFREEVCRYQGVTQVEVDIATDGEAKSVVIDQWQPTQGMPSFAKKVVGDQTNIVQKEEWSSATEGAITVTIPGKPGEMKGTAVLAESGGGVTETVDLTVKVSIPLVGGKLEGLISDLLLKALKAENKVGKDYLSR